MSKDLTATALKQSFFERPTLEVARDLLNCRLCRKSEQGVAQYAITEVEAYDGFEDKASHAHRGRTSRNEVMFGSAGIWYIYLCYGIHNLLNIVTGPQDYPAAVLIRGISSISGPGRLTKYLSIDRTLNKQSAIPENGLWVETGAPIPDNLIKATPRIGIDYAGPIWKNKPWRFIVNDKKSNDSYLQKSLNYAYKPTQTHDSPKLESLPAY